jgi:hypothetical protein
VTLFGPIYNPERIKDFAQKLRDDNASVVDFKKEKNREKAKTYYNNHIASNMVIVYCKYCQENHEPLSSTYKKNIERNGRYICEREGGHIAGSKPKKKKENPYLSEGKKQCNECQQVKPLEEFGADKSKSDSRATRCLLCRSSKARIAHNV